MFIGLFQCLLSVSDMSDEMIDENVLLGRPCSFVCLCSARLLHSSRKLIFIQSVTYTK